MSADHFSVTVDDGVCMGAGYCYSSYPEVFAENSDGTSAPHGNLSPDAAGKAKQASNICPSGAIEIHHR